MLSLKKNHTKIEKCLLLFTANTNILIPLYRELNTGGKSFIFFRFPFTVNVKLNLSIEKYTTPENIQKGEAFAWKSLSLSE